MNAVKESKLQMAEKLMKVILEEAGPKLLAAALNNVSFHGTNIEEAGYTLDSEDILLGEWYQGIEALLSAGKRIEKFTNGDLVV